MIILASSSPRRRELLKTLKKDFIILPSDCDESVNEKNPKKIALELAERKALCVFNLKECNQKQDTVIASDTIVFKNKAFGKSNDRQSAIEMLNLLNDSWHYVYTSVCVIKRGKKTSYVECAKVRFNNLTAKEIEDYVDKFSPFDKAGSYGVQDNVCVKSFKGDYNVILGLPLKRLKRILEDK